MTLPRVVWYFLFFLNFYFLNSMFYFILSAICDMNRASIIILIFEMRTVKPRKGKRPPSGHAVSQRQSKE